MDFGRALLGTFWKSRMTKPCIRKTTGTNYLRLGQASDRIILATNRLRAGKLRIFGSSASTCIIMYMRYMRPINTITIPDENKAYLQGFNRERVTHSRSQACHEIGSRRRISIIIYAFARRREIYTAFEYSFSIIRMDGSMFCFAKRTCVAQYMTARILECLCYGLLSNPLEEH